MNERVSNVTCNKSVVRTFIKGYTSDLPAQVHTLHTISLFLHLRFLPLIDYSCPNPRSSKEISFVPVSRAHGDDAIWTKICDLASISCS